MFNGKDRARDYPRLPELCREQLRLSTNVPVHTAILRESLTHASAQTLGMPYPKAVFPKGGQP
jgi:hypothetical protein